MTTLVLPALRGFLRVFRSQIRRRQKLRDILERQIRLGFDDVRLRVKIHQDSGRVIRVT